MGFLFPSALQRRSLAGVGGGATSRGQLPTTFNIRSFKKQIVVIFSAIKLCEYGSPPACNWADCWRLPGGLAFAVDAQRVYGMIASIMLLLPRRRAW